MSADQHAFPQPVEIMARGMSLRDYFAAKAMAALMVSPHLELDVGVTTYKSIAVGAYQFADAMLAERNKE